VTTGSFAATVARYDRLVRQIVGRYARTEPLRSVLEYEDLYAIGLDALWRAHQSFKPNIATLTTYAHHLITSAMLREVHYWRLRAALETLPERWRNVVLQRANGRSREEIASGLGVSKQRVQQLEAKGIDLLRAVLA
jgi:DNA-directed RNA polymerase specialized sigma subunit